MCNGVTKTQRGCPRNQSLSSAGRDVVEKILVPTRISLRPHGFFFLVRRCLSRTRSEFTVWSGASDRATIRTDFCFFGAGNVTRYYWRFGLLCCEDEPDDNNNEDDDSKNQFVGHRQGSDSSNASSVARPYQSQSLVKTVIHQYYEDRPSRERSIPR